MRRTYLVVVDESTEAESALLFAARRAAKTGGGVHMLALVPKAQFVQWSSVQATMEEEARARAEALAMSAAGTLMAEAGIQPEITVKIGDPIASVKELLASGEPIAALVLGAAPKGSPGPLVSHFAGHDPGSLPCALMIIPGALSREDIERLS